MRARYWLSFGGIDHHLPLRSQRRREAYDFLAGGRRVKPKGGTTAFRLLDKLVSANYLFGRPLATDIKSKFRSRIGKRVTCGTLDFFSQAQLRAVPLLWRFDFNRHQFVFIYGE